MTDGCTETGTLVPAEEGGDKGGGCVEMGKSRQEVRDPNLSTLGRRPFPRKDHRDKGMKMDQQDGGRPGWFSASLSRADSVSQASLVEELLRGLYQIFFFPSEALMTLEMGGNVIPAAVCQKGATVEERDALWLR